MNIFVYSLRVVEGECVLCIDLTNKILPAVDHEVLQLRLGAKVVSLQKNRWVNTMRVFDNGEFYFLLCTKHVSRQAVFDKLLEYHLSKMETEAAHLQTQRKVLERQLKAA